MVSDLPKDTRTHTRTHLHHHPRESPQKKGPKIVRILRGVGEYILYGKGVLGDRRLCVASAYDAERWRDRILVHLLTLHWTRGYGRRQRGVPSICGKGAGDGTESGHALALCWNEELESKWIGRRWPSDGATRAGIFPVKNG